MRSLSGLISTRSISSAIFSMSFVFIPLVVIAGVPIRIPEVTKGERVSKGTAFLLMVISAFTNAFSATLPVSVSLLGLRSISIMWLSVPPDIIL